MRFVEGVEQTYVLQLRQADPSLPSEIPQSHYEVGLDRHFRGLSLAQMGQYPVRVLQLAGIKFLRMWNPLPNDAMFQGGTMSLAITLGYTPLIGLAIWGLIQFRSRAHLWLACALPAIYFSFIHAVFVGSIRYRQPPMLLLIVPAAAVLVHFLFRNSGISENA